MGLFRLDVAAARGGVSQARSVWADLDGIETAIGAALDAGGAASIESEITAALRSAFHDAIGPLVTALRGEGVRVLNSGDGVITTFDGAAEQQAATTAAVSADMRFGNQIWWRGSGGPRPE